MCLVITSKCAIPIRIRCQQSGCASKRWLRQSAISRRNWRNTKRRFWALRIRFCRWRPNSSMTWFWACRSISRRFRSMRTSLPISIACWALRRLLRRINICGLWLTLRRSSISNKVAIPSSKKNCLWASDMCLMISCSIMSASRSSSLLVRIWLVNRRCCVKRRW